MCVFWEGGRGGCAGTTSHSAAHIKRLQQGESWGALAAAPPFFPGERAFPLAFWRRGPGGWGGGCHPHPLLENKSLPSSCCGSFCPSPPLPQNGGNGRLTGGRSWTPGTGGVAVWLPTGDGAQGVG